MDTVSVVYQRWIESESGWGIRPDGFSLHTSMQDLKDYIDSYHNTLPDNFVPESYERTAGKPEWIEIPADYFNCFMKDKTASLRFGGNILPDKVFHWLLEQVREDLWDAIKTIERERGMIRGVVS